jgi:hypothetical protein
MAFPIAESGRRTTLSIRPVATASRDCQCCSSCCVGGAGRWGRIGGRRLARVTCKDCRGGSITGGSACCKMPREATESRTGMPARSVGGEVVCGAGLGGAQVAGCNGGGVTSAGWVWGGEAGLGGYGTAGCQTPMSRAYDLLRLTCCPDAAAKVRRAAVREARERDMVT